MISEGEADKRKATPAAAGLFFWRLRRFPQASLGNSLTQKSQRRNAGFSLVRRDRDSNSGTKIIGHSLAGCCITTLPPLQELSAWDSRARELREGKNSEILSLPASQTEGVCILPTEHRFWCFFRSMKLNNSMKKFLFLGAFAFFALTASAQSTEAPADNKAKTEQTCSKDKKASCDKSKSARLLLQGCFCLYGRQGRFMRQVQDSLAAAPRVLLPLQTPRVRLAASLLLPDAAPRARLQMQATRSPRRTRSVATKPRA